MKPWILFLIFPSFVWAQATPKPAAVSEGDKPYTPTRLEWMTAEFRNECSVWLGGIPTVAFGLFNTKGEKGKDTLQVLVRFSDEKFRTDAQQGAETCARNIRALAREKGWDWLKTELQVYNRDSASNPKGFALPRVGADGGWARLGLQEGDVLKTVNYEAVNNERDAKRVDELYKAKKTIRIEYMRNGETKSRTLHQ